MRLVTSSGHGIPDRYYDEGHDPQTGPEGIRQGPSEGTTSLRQVALEISILNSPTHYMNEMGRKYQRRYSRRRVYLESVFLGYCFYAASR